MVKASELKQCSYFLVRYVPDVVKEEFINIGVFLYCPAEQFLDCLFSDDWRRVKGFHPQADTEFFKLLQADFEDQIREREKELELFIREMQSYSNLIQLSPPCDCLTADLAAQLQQLFQRHVGVRLAGPTKQDTRMRIKLRMTDCLRRHEVYEHRLFEKHIPASHWTDAGDPFLFDFGYKPPERAGKPNGRVRLIHNVSLQRDDPKRVEALMWTFERVLEKEPSYLTVGHEDNPDPNSRQVRFSQRVLEHEHVRLVPVSGFDEYAQSVRAELLM
jgi:hypothetical protein